MKMSSTIRNHEFSIAKLSISGMIGCEEDQIISVEIFLNEKWPNKNIIVNYANGNVNFSIILRVG